MTGSSGRSSCQRWSRAGDTGVADRVDGQPGQVDVLACERSAGVEPGEQQQVVDQVAHPVGFGADPQQRLLDLLGQIAGRALGVLGVAADHGDRCAQFVAGVGDEVPQPVLARLPFAQRGFDVLEHVVERVGDLADLGAGCQVRDPLRQRDLPAGQRQVGHPSAVPATRVSGRSESRTQTAPATTRDDQRDHEHDRLDPGQPVDGLVDRVLRQPGDEQVAVGPGGDDDAVLAEVGQPIVVGCR